MTIKTIVVILTYFTPYFLIMTGVVTQPWLFFGCWIMIGIGMAGIGLCVMHDANHGAYSPNARLNMILGYSMNLIGANAEIWKLQHNRLHHTYTNIEGADDDIHTPPVLRFSPYTKRYWIHKYQFLYVWFFYGISTLSWVTMKEFVQLFRYRKLGLIKSKKKFRGMLRRLILWKVIYHTYMLVLPLAILDAPAWLILISFFAMHFTTGLILSLIFQTAHVMPECKFDIADKNGTIHSDWAVHEMMTTSNYAPSSRLFSWMIGGLNYQIEHHLFPKICHVHYRKISKIVASTAKEFNIPYYTQKNFMVALWHHTRMLYRLGRWDAIPEAA
ncbi:MAG: acyl-CoA desaturase [Flavobacteriales bacterium]|nr:acyl-CoA desaturase [Flavobacteriales bacterium]